MVLNKWFDRVDIIGLHYYYFVIASCFISFDCTLLLLAVSMESLNYKQKNGHDKFYMQLCCISLGADKSCVIYLVFLLIWEHKKETYLLPLHWEMFATHVNKKKNSINNLMPYSHRAFKLKYIAQSSSLTQNQFRIRLKLLLLYLV